MVLSRSRLALIIATICLAAMVVSLGAAAKHSQFETTAHATQYLKQSVKMVSGNHDHAQLPRPVASPLPFELLADPQAQAMPVRVSVPITASIPLLV